MKQKQPAKPNRKKKPPRRPPALLWWLAVCLVYPVMKLRFKLKVVRELPGDLTGPYLILCNHGSVNDCIYAAIAALPERPNIVAAQYFFNRKWLAPLLNLVGAIPKNQFTPDIGSIRTMVKAVQAGHCVMIFPEGSVTFDGAQSALPPGIERLIKMLKVPVVVQEIRGSHLAKPKWADHPRRTRVTVTVKPLLNAEQVQSLSAGEIGGIVERAIAFNDYDWQRERRQVIRGKSLAEGITDLLYRCPRCSGEFQMEARGNTLTCTHCGNTAIMDEYGLMHPKGEADVVFEDTVAWCAFQKRVLEEDLQAGRFRLGGRRSPLPGRARASLAMSRWGRAGSSWMKAASAMTAPRRVVRYPSYFPPRPPSPCPALWATISRFPTPRSTCPSTLRTTAKFPNM